MVVRERPDALFVGADPFLNSRRVQLSLLAMRHAIPAIYSNREFAEVGERAHAASAGVRIMYIPSSMA